MLTLLILHNAENITIIKFFEVFYQHYFLFVYWKQGCGLLSTVLNGCAHMRRFSVSRDGLTLVEVLVSIAIVFVLVGAITQSILSSQFMTSLSRHKIQAMYASQQMIEHQRQKTFVAASSLTTGVVSLDASAGFNGVSRLTVTNLDAYRNRVDVEIDWPESVLGSNMTMKEYYSTNIANDSVPN